METGHHDQADPPRHPGSPPSCCFPSLPSLTHHTALLGGHAIIARLAMFTRLSICLSIYLSIYIPSIQSKGTARRAIRACLPTCSNRPTRSA